MLPLLGGVNGLVVLDAIGWQRRLPGRGPGRDWSVHGPNPANGYGLSASSGGVRGGIRRWVPVDSNAEAKRSSVESS